MAGAVRYEEVVAPGRPWGRVVRRGETLRIVDLEGRQAVDFLCYNAAAPADRYSATNTLKVQGRLFVERGTVLYSDRGAALLTVTADSCGRHDTIYGCCSEANNLLRYGRPGPGSCYANFTEILAAFGLGRAAIVANINWFMNVPVEADGRLAVVDGISVAGSLVELRAERDVLAVLSNCPQILNPCNGFNPTPIAVSVLGPD